MCIMWCNQIALRHISKRWGHFFTLMIFFSVKVYSMLFDYGNRLLISDRFRKELTIVGDFT